MGILTDQLRMATVVCAEETLLGVMTAPIFKEII